MIISQLLSLPIFALLVGEITGISIDNLQASVIDTDSALSLDNNDYRHNIKMLTGLENVRLVTRFQPVHFADRADFRVLNKNFEAPNHNTVVNEEAHI